MKKPRDWGYTKKLPESLVDIKFKKAKRKCSHCTATYIGTKYQKWCSRCRVLAEKVEWDWCTWN